MNITQMFEVRKEYNNRIEEGQQGKNLLPDKIATSSSRWGMCWALAPDALTLEDMTGFVMPAGAFGGHEGGSV